MYDFRSLRKARKTRITLSTVATILVVALVVGGIYYAYSTGMISDFIASIMGTNEPHEKVLPEVIGKEGYASLTVSGQAGYEVAVVDKKLEENKGKFASVTVPGAAIAAGVEKVDVTVFETNKPEAVVVEEGNTATAYYVDVEGLAENNTAPVKVYIFVDEEYNSDNLVAVYYDNKPVEGSHISSGYVVFETTDFGIYTIVTQPTPVVEPEPDPEPVINVPVAEVTYMAEHVNVDLDWNSYGTWYPTEGLDKKFEAAFEFKAPHTTETIKECEYKDWYCDFYVKLDRDLGANQIFLGGNYGSFGWVGFHNGDLTLEANEEIPLLGSFTSNPWTYYDVVSSVGTFICGVGDVGNALEGATFTVTLRLTNPEDATESYDVNVVTYTFGGDYSINSLGE